MAVLTYILSKIQKGLPFLLIRFSLDKSVPVAEFSQCSDGKAKNIIILKCESRVENEGNESRSNPAKKMKEQTGKGASCRGILDSG